VTRRAVRVSLLTAVGLLALEAGLARGPAGASRKERLADLSQEERVWLTEFVAPIILKEEEDLFLELTEGYQWEILKRDFWERRERDGLPAPFGPGFKARYEELRPLVDSVYDGWKSDAGRMVMRNGEPADIHQVMLCDKVFRCLEIWTYTYSGSAHGNVHHFFYRSHPGLPRKLYRVDRSTIGGDSSDSDIFFPSRCRQKLADLARDCRPDPGDPCVAPVCLEACDVYRVYQEILARQGNAFGGMTETARLFKLPDISTEGLDRLRKRFATTADPNARPLSVEAPSSKPRTAPEPTPTPEPRRLLTAEEIRERIVHLEPKYRQFLELAGPLLTLNELSAFVQMVPKDRDRFIKEFWKRRS
jgi:GWxTD domain-containing protein